MLDWGLDSHAWRCCHRERSHGMDNLFNTTLRILSYSQGFLLALHNNRRYMRDLRACLEQRHVAFNHV